MENKHVTGSGIAQGNVSWEFSDWDTEVLGVKTGIITECWATNDAGTPFADQREALLEGVEACKVEAIQQGVQHLSARIPEWAHAASTALEMHGFRVIESFITLERAIPNLYAVAPLEYPVRVATPEDEDAVADLTVRAYRHSRKDVDPYFTDVQKAQFRRAWVNSIFNGRADKIFVAVANPISPELDAQLVGFIALLDKDYRVGGVDLLAVEPKLQGRGIGKLLLSHAINDYIETGKADTLRMGTQGKNYPAMNLYTGMGFKVIKSELSFHWHRPEGEKI